MLRWAMSRDGAGEAELSRGIAPDLAVKSASIAVWKAPAEITHVADTGEFHQMPAPG